MKRRNEVLVGIVSTVAVGIAVVGSLYLARGGLLPGYPLYSVFEWGSGLKQGQPVLLSGVNVGYVDQVSFREDGKLVVAMRIGKKFRVPKGTTAQVAPNGFFGDMMIALEPDRPNPEKFAQGDTVPAGIQPAQLGDVIARVDSIGRSLHTLTTALNKEFVEEKGFAEIRATVASANTLITKLSQVAEVQSAELTKTQQSLRRLANAVDSAQVDSTVRALRSAGTNVTELTSELKTTTNQLNGILAKLESGQGSAGKLLTDDGMYRDVRGLLQRLDSLTADFKKNPKKYVKLSIF